MGKNQNSKKKKNPTNATQKKKEKKFRRTIRTFPTNSEIKLTRAFARINSRLRTPSRGIIKTTGLIQFAGGR